MSSDGWNPTIVSRDGEEIEARPDLAGNRESTRRERQTVNFHARELEDQVVPNPPDINEEDDDGEETFECDVCGETYESRELESVCQRAHARTIARLDLVSECLDRALGARDWTVVRDARHHLEGDLL